MILIKTADISNEMRPMDVADIWLECLFEEYFKQVLHDTCLNTSVFHMYDVINTVVLRQMISKVCYCILVFKVSGKITVE